MRIASLTLRDYIPIKDSGITELTIAFTADVQLIIGSNGCGKTRILNQLSVYPPPKTIFTKHGRGFKSLIVDTDNGSFRLESDYERASSPHLFIDDHGTNRNEGRTTDAQEELIGDQLGITPLVDDLIMNRYVFPKMTAAQREKFLMDTNPDKIGFVRDELKKISTKLRANKATLAHLQTRKISLEHEFLDPEALAAVHNERATLDRELALFQQHLMTLEVGLRTTAVPSAAVFDTKAVAATLQRCRYQLATLTAVSRDDDHRLRQREQAVADHAVARQKQSDLDAAMQRCAAQLVELEVHYRDLQFDGNLAALDETIARLEDERGKLVIERPEFELSSQDLADRYQEWERIRDRLQLFASLPVKLIPSRKRQAREQRLARAEYRLTAYHTRLSDRRTQLQDLEKRHSIAPQDIPDSPCAKERCPLYSHFFDAYTSTEQQRQKLTQAIAKGERMAGRLDRYINTVHRYFDRVKPYTDTIQWLIGIANANPVLHHVLRKLDILMVLSTQPNRIAMQLRTVYDHIGQWHKLKALDQDLETAYAMRTKYLSSDNHDTVKLVTTITETKAELDRLRLALFAASRTASEQQRLLGQIDQFDHLKTTVLRLRDQYGQMLHDHADRHERRRLAFLKQGLETLRSQHFVRMSDIERTLRTQTGLHDRYQTEVIAQMEIVQQRIDELTHIERALEHIPRDNMVAFINSLFRQANLLISMVWTLPLAIDLLAADAPLDYEFTVSGDNQSNRKMKDCSEGQIEIISLALNLALRMVLGHGNIPLCLDESGRTFDTTHANNFIALLRRLLDDGVISQLFMVSHHASIHSNFTNLETFVVREDNIVTPETYNTHVVMT